MQADQAKSLLEKLFRAGLARVMPQVCLPPALSARKESGRTLVLGAGKAAAAMAQTVAQTLDGPISGMVVTRYGHGVEDDIPGIRVVEAAHPVPDSMSLKAARRMQELASGLRQGDRLIFLASGGGSSLLAAPVPGLDFAAKQALMRHLLHSGAPISDINCVRRHLSAIKGGRLAKLAGAANVHTLIISDVPGDQAHDVASGPTVADPSTLSDAEAVIRKFGAPDEALVRRLLQNADNETVKQNGVRWRTDIAACATDCLAAAEEAAQKEGLHVINLGGVVEGEARDVGAAHARLALEGRRRDQPVLILSGGETTVTVKNPNGAGGRNMEYALGLALALEGAPGIYALAADTDGIDGSEEAAGAFIGPHIIKAARSAGLGPESLLHANDSHALFKATGSLFVTGPTRTNVNDFRAILVLPDAKA